MNHSETKANYGIDAPPVVRNLILAGVGCFALGMVANLLLAQAQLTLVRSLSLAGFFAGIGMWLGAGLMIWSSLYGKFRERDRLMELIDLRGDEQVLDVGCGRGLLLIAAAKRLKTGKAVGLDLWQAEDQSGNSPRATLANARAEGVFDRVKLETGDMRQMPFADHTFDVIVSSLAIHNVYEKEGRVKALREISRALKPGGRVALLDIQHTEEYSQTLRDLGWMEVQRTALHFWIFPPVRIVMGKKSSG
ncbi:class I SAM-dependent methyltransferase [Candidatus Acetothermia bacterium]|nr:class I SAM-dependent methyltransferase [Candidatus Acetothermia bacterium]MBI3660803.1 class I SAM-dependent methyltransferase [Candidatus Acetothermia bacterium]